MPCSWGSCGKSCETRQKHIATVACGIELRGAQGAPHATLAPVRGVHREMAPPRAVVIPQVVVGIVGAGAQGQLDAGGAGRITHEVPGFEVRIVRIKNSSEPTYSSVSPVGTASEFTVEIYFVQTGEGLHIGSGSKPLSRHLCGLLRQVARPLLPTGRS